MYTITSRERRITNYVREQAYAWLYEKILANEYVCHSNEADAVILNIKSNHCVTKESYQQFCSYFDNDPCNFMLNGKKHKKENKITSDRVDNYFLWFVNGERGEVLPAGFVKSFFEDDYETAAEVEEFYKQFLNASLDEFILGCQKKRNQRIDEMEEVKKLYSGLLRPKIKYHLINLFVKILLPLFVFLSSALFFVGELAAKGKIVMGPENLLFLAVQALALIFTFFPAVRAVKMTVFYIRWIRLKLYVVKTEFALGRFNSDTIESFKTHFTQRNVQLIRSRVPVMEGDFYFARPRGKRQYLYVANFDKNKVLQKAKNLAAKYNNKVNILNKKENWVRSLVNCLLWIVLGYGVGHIQITPDIRVILEDVLMQLADMFGLERIFI